MFPTCREILNFAIIKFQHLDINISNPPAYGVKTEKFEDTKGVKRSSKSKNDRKYNSQNKKDKKEKQRSTKHYIETQRFSKSIPLKPGFNSGALEGLSVIVPLVTH